MSSITQGDTYFAARPPQETIDALLKKSEYFYNSVYSMGYLEKVKRLYSMYHGMSYDDNESSHQINFEGEQGELLNINVNHIRNIGQNMLNLITSSRPVMEARALNTDYKSLVQTKLANGLLDYYMREKKLESILKLAVEYAISLGSGYIKLEWDATSGKQIDVDEETGTAIYEGDIKFTNLSPMDVVFDNTKENEDNDWLMVRTFRNKYDLMAKYPEFAEKISALKTKSELEMISPAFYMYGINETTDVPLMEFYHKRSDALPNGRYILFLSEDITLYDGPLPYPTIPVYKIVPSKILGTPFGYTPLFDLMPLQQTANMLYSTILTNQQAFGVQNIVVPRGVDISVEQVSGGMNLIQLPAGAQMPQPLNLTQTPKEIFDYLGTIIQTMETISGINSVIRGNPEASLRSASALALIQSNSIQYMSGLAQQYNQLIEDVGTGLIKILQMYASTPRVAAIVGEQNRSYLKEFSGDDLDTISRVAVSAGNALSKTTAGRLQMASELLQYQLLKDPQQYLAIIETGNLDLATQGVQKELNLIVSENEQMLNGELPPVLDLDDHAKHINEHKALMADASMRKDPQLVQVVMQHISAHIEALKSTDPILLQITGQQPIQPPAPPMPAPGQPIADLGNAPFATGAVDQNNLPQPGAALPTPPAPFENAPVTTGQPV